MTTSSTSNLDVPLRALFADAGALNRTVKALALVRGANDWESLQALHAAVDEIEGTGTLRDALGRINGLGAADVDEAISLMATRDAAVQRTLDAELGELAVQALDADGLVLLDQPGSLAAFPKRVPVTSGAGMELAPVDVGKALADPVERENRLARMRKAQPGRWDGEDGRGRFADADRAHLDIGRDIVATAERAPRIAAARRTAAAVGAQLDRAMRDTNDRRQRARALDAEIGRLRGERTGLDRPDAGMTDSKLRLLDGTDRETLSPEIQLRILDLGAERPELDYEVLRKTVLEAAEPGVPLTAEESLAALDSRRAVSRTREREPAPSAPPMSTSAQLNARVLARMQELGRGDGDFIATLDEVLAEEADR